MNIIKMTKVGMNAVALSGFENATDKASFEDAWRTMGNEIAWNPNDVLIKVDLIPDATDILVGMGYFVES